MNPALSTFVPGWRLDPRAAFDVAETATGAGVVPFEIGDRAYAVYRNVNLSIYSGQTCNARCPFCVEELRPASRGRDLASQKRVEPDDARYFRRLDEVLAMTKSLDPSLSITGGEPSKDPRLPGILERVARHGLRKRTLTTNGSGLLDALPSGGDLLDQVLGARLAHLNLSRAHWDARVNQRIMRIDPPQTEADLRRIVTRAQAAGTRPRLSCVLLAGVVDSLETCLRYLSWAASLGVDNVVFRQLMQFDRSTYSENVVTRYSESSRVALDPILERIRPSGGGPAHPGFRFQRHVLGYYYAVEVFRFEVDGFGMGVCFEGADLADLERQRDRDAPNVIHELIFHPGTELCSTWQPWDGQIF